MERGALEIGGWPYRFTVLLPEGYANSQRRYPVLYWLHGAGGNQDSAFTDPLTPRFMERLTAGRDVILVIPEGGWLGMYRNWGKPGHQWEDFHMRLIRHVDATYRTQPRRQKRAVAGFSMGGLGAMAYAARYPRLFGQAASFSGLLDTSWRSPVLKAFLLAASPLLLACGDQTELPGFWPDLLADGPTWEEHNPTALASRLNRTYVHVATGDGTPCDQADTEVLAQESPRNPLRAAETFILDGNDTFHEALLEAGVRHSYDAYGCGIHSWRYWERELARWFPRMMEGFRGT